jgi:WD40 repeat protein
MRTNLLAILLLFFPAVSFAETEAFDGITTDELPDGWIAGVTGKGSPKWSVVQDSSAPSKPNVLKQSGHGTFPWCVKKEASLADGFVEVKFKPISGEEDQAGGLIWRWQDGDNYYIARANALENNVTIYHTVAGNRVSFKNANVKVTPGEWHVLRVDFKGQRFVVTFDGKAVIEADDATFAKPGTVGVWTKADSVTSFDDFRFGTVEEPLKLIRTIPLGEVDGRIDHMALDILGQRLFVAALGNNSLEVIDLTSGKVSQRITGLAEPQGVCFIPGFQRLAVAIAKDGSLRLYDSQLLTPVATVDLQDDADNVRYDSKAKRLWVGYGNGGLAVINIETNSQVADIKLDGHPESFQLESKGRRIFVNVPTAGHVAVVDRDSLTVVAKWPVPPGSANFPMTLDEPNQRLFVGCRKPAQMLVLDTATGKEVARLAVAGDTDDLFFDNLHKRIVVSGGEGVITVIQQTDPSTYVEVGKIPTATGARTSYFDVQSGLLYVAIPHRGQQQAEVRVFKVQ